MSQPFQELVERLTRRFSDDPELRLEIEKELRGHLEDCAAEFAAGGMAEKESEEAAAKSLGDEGEIEEKLWQANRRRLRLRNATRWALGITAAPVAAVAVIAVGWGAVVSLIFCGIAMSMWMGPMPSGVWNGHSIIPQRMISSLGFSLDPLSQRIFNPPEQSTAVVQWAADLTNQHPVDPVYAANYVLQLLWRGKLPVYEDKTNIDPALVQQVLDACRRGSAIEPHNAFYPLVMASLELGESSTLVPESDPLPPASSFSFEADWLGQAKKTETITIDRWHVDDPALFQQGLADFAAAAHCEYLEDYVIEMLKRRLSVLPAPTSLSDQIFRRILESHTLLPHLNVYRQATLIAWSAALDAAENNQAARAMELLANAKRLGVMAAARPGFVIDVLFEESTYQGTLGAEIVADRLLHLPAQSQAAKDRYVAGQRQDWSIRTGQGTDTAGNQRLIRLHGDLITAALMPPASLLTPAQLTPGRKAEYAWLDRTMLTLLATGLLLIAAEMVIAGWFRKRGKMLFMGWRRLGIATLLSVLPVVAYLIYTYIQPLNGREYGARISLERLSVEYMVVAIALRRVILFAADRALAARATEIGSHEFSAPQLGRARLITDLALALCVIGYLAVWNRMAPHIQINDCFPTHAMGFVLVALLMILGLNEWKLFPWWGLFLLAISLAAGFIEQDPRDTALSVALIVALAVLAIWRFARSLGSGSATTFSRGASIAPLLVTTALAMLCIAGPILRWEESHAVKQMVTAGVGWNVADEIDLPPWHAIQQQLVAQSGPVTP